MTEDRKSFGSVSLAPGSLGGQAFESNRKNLRRFPYSPEMADDSFIHILASGIFTFTTSSSFKLESVPCFHFLYIYEGALTVQTFCPPESRYLSELLREASLTGAAGHVLFFHAPDGIDFRLAAGRCRFFYAALAGAALGTYASLIPPDTCCPPELFGASCLPDTIGKILAHDTCESGTEAVMFSKWMNDIFTDLCVYHSDRTRKREQIPDYLCRMKEILDSEFEKPLTLEELEQRLGKSRYRLCREFARCYGKTPLQYLNSRRIEQAKLLLLTTELPVHRVGSLVGIDNTNHFINLFKRKTGATPLVFRQEAPAAISGLHYPCRPDDRPQ